MENFSVKILVPQQVGRLLDRFFDLHLQGGSGLTATSSSKLLFKTMPENRFSDELFACVSKINT